MFAREDKTENDGTNEENDGINVGIKDGISSVKDAEELNKSQKWIVKI